MLQFTLLFIFLTFIYLFLSNPIIPLCCLYLFEFSDLHDSLLSFKWVFIVHDYCHMVGCEMLCIGLP